MRTIQFRWFIVAGFGTCVIVWLFVFTSDTKNNLTVNENKPYRILEPKVTYNPDNDTLVDLHDFQFIMNNVSLCMTSMTAPTGSQSAIAIIVHTARSNFLRRYAIRNTWGSVKKFKGWHIHLTFLLGIDPNSDPEFESLLWNESMVHGDMIMGNFVDSYRNLTYKHIMGYKWVNTFCPSAQFILKTDDDIYADIFQIVEVLLVQLIVSEKTYICENMGGNAPYRDVTYKWYVSKDEYSEDMYPDFCSGSGYVMTADGAAKIYSVSSKTKFFWVDDVFVTGILRDKYHLLVASGVEKANSSGSSLGICSMSNQHHLGEKEDMLEWCKKGMISEQLSYIFILLERNEDQFVRNMFCIWNKVRLMRFAMSNAITSDVN